LIFSRRTLFRRLIGSGILRGSKLSGRPAAVFGSEPLSETVVMKVKLTTKQKRDRRWKIKRRKARRQKTGI